MFCFMIHVIPDTIRIFLFWLVFVVLFQSGTRVRRHFISLRTYTPGTKNCDNFRVLPRPFDPRPQQLHTGYHGYEYMPRINSWNNPWNNPYGHWVCCYRRFKIAPKPLGNRWGKKARYYTKPFGCFYRSGKGGEEEPAMWPRIWGTTRRDRKKRRSKIINEMNKQKERKKKCWEKKSWTSVRKRVFSSKGSINHSPLCQAYDQSFEHAWR